MSKESSKTFWGIIKQYNIVIPPIQRDYVQGRPSREVAEARDVLLSDIKKAVDSSNILNLNFVYGKTVDTLFLPLDGQQRLTTLFLLHWFALLCKDENFEESINDAIDVLRGFSYQARCTSRDFFERITTASMFLDIRSAWKDSDGRISDCIADASWFHPSWKYDPTIESVLVVLDRMETVFSECDDLWEKLTNDDDCPIRFEWLDVEHIGNEDDLYIKMNARGKILSPYENFKAELEGASLGALGYREHVEFFSSLDQGWLDFFWRLGSPENYDGKMYSFLVWTFWNRWSSLNAYGNKDTGDAGGVRNLQSRAFNLVAKDFDTGLENASTLTQKTFDYIKYTLDYVSSENANHEIVDIIDRASPAWRNPDYSERIMLQVVQSYLFQVKGRFDEGSWSEWCRVANNLVRFARRYQGFNTLGRYSGAVKCIVGMECFIGDLLTKLADEDNVVSGFIPDEQILEERLRAVLIKKSEKWRDAIILGEEVEYFEGKIGFLLNYSGINTMEDARNATDENLERFVSYLNSISGIFGPSDLVVDGNLLRRALLTKGDYSMPKKKLSYYIAQNDRDVDWRAFFRMFDSSHRKANSYFKLLLDDIEKRGCDIEEAMNGIIADYVWDGCRDDAWAKYFIDEPLLFREIGANFQFRTSQLYSKSWVCWMPVGTNTVASGFNKELFTALTAIELRRLGWRTEWKPRLKGMQAGIQYDVSLDGKEYSIGISDDFADKLLCVYERNSQGDYIKVFDSNDYEPVVQFINNAVARG